MDEFLKAAIDEAKTGLSEKGIPIGSVLVKDGKIVGRGHNKRVQDNDPMTHAEIDCLRNAGRVVTRTMLLEQVWEFHFDPKTKIVETHISRLRAKIDKDFPVKLIQTVRGVGYVLKERP